MICVLKKVNEPIAGTSYVVIITNMKFVSAAYTDR